MPLALIVVATVLAHAAFNAGRLTISLDALALGASRAPRRGFRWRTAQCAKCLC
jgi:hypothetical protein